MGNIKEHYHDEIEKGQREAMMQDDEKDKRYLAFAFSHYYPNGGLCDMIGSYDTIEEAVQALRENYNDYKDLYDRIAGKSIDLEMYGL